MRPTNYEAQLLGGEILKDLFEMSEDGSTVLWSKNSKHGRNKTGKPAGHLAKYGKDKKRLSGKAHSVYINYYKFKLRAEHIAYFLHTGKLIGPGEKVLHKDGNILNNHKSNLVKIAI